MRKQIILDQDKASYQKNEIEWDILIQRRKKIAIDEIFKTQNQNKNSIDIIT